MPWITRTKKKHLCNTPNVERAAAGDEWYCWRCRRVWRVETYTHTKAPYWVKTTKRYSGG